jgi:hypothetical protein
MTLVRSSVSSFILCLAAHKVEEKKRKGWKSRVIVYDLLKSYTQFLDALFFFFFLMVCLYHFKSIGRPNS